MVGVWARRRALHSFLRCRVVDPYCRRVVVARRCRVWLSRTIDNDERRPMSSFVVWLAHLLPSCSLASIVIWWSSCRGIVCRTRVSVVTWCCGCAHKIYHDDER